MSFLSHLSYLFWYPFWSLCKTLINLSLPFPLDFAIYLHNQDLFLCTSMCHKQCQHNLFNVRRLHLHVQHVVSQHHRAAPPGPRVRSMSMAPPARTSMARFSTPPSTAAATHCTGTNLWRQGNAHACHHIMHTHPLGTPIGEYPQYSQNKHHLWEFWYFSSIKTQAI